MALFKRILIANRGEIACRIIQTARALGIETVAVYSEADREARHVRLADQAHYIGGPAARDSYLNIDNLLAIAKAADVEAIHPGYGFLAENATFAQQVVGAGIVFIGPTAKTIEQMGSKAAAKALMMGACVPLIGGYHGDDQSDARLVDEAHAIGFPLMIKAAAGGGGKGMRIVRDDSVFLDALATARREAMSAFGDDRVILERYLEKPRHIEAQILGDQHGRVIHLYERDCSAQRRHQKVIEEAPALGLPDTLKSALWQAAVQAGQAVDYIGAGTVEFLVDVEAERFYFLEMNTRLQVEHPVTEMITGWDLVEWQLRIACGEALPPQSDIPPPNGHAFEARIYAEDPSQGFLPATGTLHTLHWPNQARIDAGVDVGDRIGIDYDPMIAKLIVHGKDRPSALKTLEASLATTLVEGVTTNIGFLQTLAHCEPMQESALDTGYLDRSLHDLLTSAHANDALAAWVAAVARCDWLEADAVTQQPMSPWAATTGWRLGLPPQAKNLTLKGHDALIHAHIWGDQGQYEIRHADQTHIVRADTTLILNQAGHRLTEIRAEIRSEIGGALEEQAIEAVVHMTRQGLIELTLKQQRSSWRVLTHDGSGQDDGAMSGHIQAPMPGAVVAVHVSVGQSIQAGEVVAVMEAMKMELSIKAPVHGTVEAVHAKAGDRVQAEAVLIEIEPA